jgi:diguanylate cyclase (GGDEF)-like protein/PAS domain S-box-containing protein
MVGEEEGRRRMSRLSTVTRITTALVSLTVTVLLMAQAIGLIPNPYLAALETRRKLCEVIAISCSMMPAQGDASPIKAAAAAIKARNPEILSIGVRRQDGGLALELGEHRGHWNGMAQDRSNPSQVQVPLFRGRERWGTVEIRFRPLGGGGAWEFINHPTFRLVTFVAVGGYLLYLVYLRRTLRYLDPSAVIPARVKAMLDTLAEGVLVLDRQERIVLANESFATTVGKRAEALLGLKAGDIQWMTVESERPPQSFPWRGVLRDGKVQRGVMLSIPSGPGRARSVSINCSPICGGDGRVRGVLATFDDVTLLEAKNAQLRETLEMLRQSRDEIDRQNKELQALATTDPLTGCRNRRSFYTEFQTAWSSAARYSGALSCVMVDVDHFKRVNDRYGHSVGDQVLQHVAECLRSMVRDTDVICRYGGEEFCIVLTQTDLAGAALAAERYRQAIESSLCGGIAVTVSLGVSSVVLGARTPLELLDQADQALYVAKRAGRNRAVRWDEVKDYPVAATTGLAKVEGAREARGETPILFHAVSALMAALAYRDKSTAAHCQRVADWCVAMGCGVMSIRECFVLEVAALLHDIGKLGVPDAILLKPGPLTQEEWTVMRGHDQMGVEIIAAAFASPELTAVVRTHHAWFGGSPYDPDLPKGQGIPTGARILTIADAYDAMVSDRVYRKGRSCQEAFAELRRCAGTQFDPELVERFIEVVVTKKRSEANRPAEISARVALMIRLEVERLACAVEAQDVGLIAELGRRVATVAAADGLGLAVRSAEEVLRCVEGVVDWDRMVGLTNELLMICRSQQHLGGGEAAGPCACRGTEDAEDLRKKSAA